MLRLWEMCPVLPDDLATLIVFLPKMSGGVRPIALLCGLLRVWSRIRQPMVAAWEAAVHQPFHFGIAGRCCTRAAWIHNALLDLSLIHISEPTRLDVI
eukprot:263833-Prorocentrum_lima.AAC.1